MNHNPKSLANLKPIQKGERRNLTNHVGGRKKGLEKIFNAAITIEEQKEIIQAAKNEALNGNIKAAEFIFDRLYGKPIAVDLLGNENRTLIQNNFNIDVSGKSASELIEILQNTQIDDVESEEILE